MPPFVQLATILSGSQHSLESGGSKSIATASSRRQRTLTDGRSQIRHAAALAARTVTWLRNEGAAE
jgi:hypothetical protein